MKHLLKEIYFNLIKIIRDSTIGPVSLSLSKVWVTFREISHFSYL